MTKIAWTDESWNPVTGCSKVSEGCAHCYAEKLSKRFGWSWDVTLHPDRLDIPLHWRKPRMVFVPSMGDLFHCDVPDDFIAGVFLVMARCGPTSIVPNSPRHTFQVLTKRAERMRDFVHAYRFPVGKPLAEIPLENVWLGVSVENQKAADERIPLLLDTPAAVRFVSAEPLLGPLDLTRINLGIKRTNGYGDQRIEWDSLTGWEHQYSPDAKPDAFPRASVSNPQRRISWVIVGGESGGPPERRLVERCLCSDRTGIYGCPRCKATGWMPTPEALRWVRDIRDQCQAAGVPFFFKQWGPRAGQGTLLDGVEHKETP